MSKSLKHYIQAIAGITSGLVLGLILFLNVGTTSYGNYEALSYSISNGEVCITDCDTSVTSIEIPKEIDGYPVTSIGQYAFYNCSSLKSVSIPSSVTSIGNNAFHHCSSLESVSIPFGITSIGLSTFCNCSSLKSVSIPSSVTSIGQTAFCNCSSLESVSIPASVASIGDWAFRDCSSLERVNITDVESWCAISFHSDDSNPLYYAENLYINGTQITDLIIPDGVTCIGDYAFYNCSSLESVSIPASVTSIGDSAFWDCSSLERVNITDVKSWCAISFDMDMSNPLYYAENLYINGTQITDLIIPDGVTSIGEDAFHNCRSLESVSIPVSVTSIGEDAFHNCSSLESVSIPSGVTSIGAYAFDNCSSLESVSIPSSVTSIGGWAFSGCSSLERVDITDVKSWCAISFDVYTSNPLYYAENLYINGTQITDLIIPDGVTSIGDYAFNNCRGLESVSIPASVTSIGEDAFGWVGGLERVNITDVESWCAISFHSSDSNPLYWAENLYINGTQITDLIIPDGVTCMGDYAFYNCRSLESVSIPASVTSIGDSAFWDCSSLERVNITDVKSWCAISFDMYTSNPLYYAENLYINGTQITDLIIPDGVTCIGDYAFYNCRSLESVSIPASVTSIGDSAFRNCSSLESVSIPSGITSIGVSTFCNCSSLKSVSIPSSVTSIGALAFDSCESLTIYLKSAYAEEYAATNLIAYVIVPESIEIQTLPNKIFYYLHESADMNGLVVNAKYYDGRSEEVTHKCDISGFDSAKEGNCPITVTYMEQEVDFLISVSRYIQAIDYNAHKKLYHVGDTCDLVGKEFTATYEDVDTISEKVTITEDMIAGFDTILPGVKHISINYCNAKFEFDIVVIQNNMDVDNLVNVDFGETHIYNGEEICPEVAVSVGNVAVIENTDFVVNYQNNIECGIDAKVIIEGISAYEGFSVERSFAIIKKDISDATISSISSQTYTGSPIEPSVTVKSDGVTLVQNEDYVIQYLDNIEVGTATVKVIGIGNYCGKMQETFTIKQQSTTNITMGGHADGVSYRTWNGTIFVKKSGRTWLNLKVYYEDELLYEEQSWWYSSYGGVDESFSIDFSDKQEGVYTVIYSMSDYSSQLYPTGNGGYVQGGYQLEGEITAHYFYVYNYENTTVSPTEISVKTPENTGNKTCYLSVSATPVNADLTSLVWKSSDETVATVENGLVTYYQPGSTTITASINGLEAKWYLELEPLDLYNGGTITDYDETTGKATVIYNGEILEEGTDYTLTISEKNDITIVKATGNGLFTGSITRTYYGDTNIPYLCEHTYGGWKQNENQHWRICATCEHMDRYGHEYGNDSTCDVCEYKKFLYGDPNGDASIDGRDVITICNYLANYDYDTDTSTVAVGQGADANGDGFIDGRDVIIICNYLANYDYDTGSSTVVLGPQN